MFKEKPPHDGEHGADPAEECDAGDGEPSHRVQLPGEQIQCDVPIDGVAS